MKVKFIYFDIGGVLINWKKSFQTAGKKFGVRPEDFFEVFDEVENQITLGKISVEDFWQISRKKLGISGGKNYNLLKSWVGDYEPIEPMHKLAKKLSQSYDVGLISNIYKRMHPLILKTGKIPDINYKSIILSYEVGMKKPEIGIYKLAEKKAGVKPNEILFIDDSEKYLEPMDKLGWNNYLFDSDYPEKSVSELEKILEI